MIVTIRTIINDNYVSVFSQYGDFCGKYFGKDIAVSKKCDVELEMPGIFKSNDFEIIEDCLYNISTSDGLTKISGLVQEIDNDILYLRFGLDLIAIETLDCNSCEMLVGKFIRITVRDLQLFDTGILG